MGCREPWCVCLQQTSRDPFCNVPDMKGSLSPTMCSIAIKLTSFSPCSTLLPPKTALTSGFFAGQNPLKFLPRSVASTEARTTAATVAQRSFQFEAKLNHCKCYSTSPGCRLPFSWPSPAPPGQNANLPRPWRPSPETWRAPQQELSLIHI